MPSRRILTPLALLAAAGAAVAAAWVGAGVVERHSVAAVTRALAVEGAPWAGVQADGLQLILTGEAPSEPARLRAVSRAGRVVDPSRVVDAMAVAAVDPPAPPRYAVEILRNDRGISLIGLVPAEGGRTALERGLAGFVDVTDMVETADRAVPPMWNETMAFALEALESLPQAKVSATAGHVEITAIADSDAARRSLETQLSRAVPDGITLALDIQAPRPVIAPFTTRFVLRDGRARFEACAVDGADALRRVQAAAAAAGLDGRADCRVALGVPSATWGAAVAEGIGAVARLGGGSVTFSDADVTLVGAEDVDPAAFDTAAAELEAALPDIYTLSAVRPEPVVIDGTGDGGGTPEFVATRSPEGQVQLRGRLRDDAQARAVGSYGRALFGTASTYVATREDPDLPAGWSGRVLAALEALSRLHAGAVVVQPDVLDLRGTTGNPDAEAEISRLLSDKLGGRADYRIEVRYDEMLDPTLNIPTPEECVDRLNAVQDGGKLSFAPGEAVITADSAGVLGDLVAVLRDCDRIVAEVGGHTDSQGREEMNAALSQERADAVRLALIERGVSPGQLVARGYGEAEPIADNGTEAGREANRRIAFTLAGGRSAAERAADAAPAADADGAEGDGETLETQGSEAPDGEDG